MYHITNKIVSSLCLYVFNILILFINIIHRPITDSYLYTSQPLDKHDNSSINQIHIQIVSTWPTFKTDIVLIRNSYNKRKMSNLIIVSPPPLILFFCCKKIRKSRISSIEAKHKYWSINTNGIQVNCFWIRPSPLSLMSSPFLQLVPHFPVHSHASG